MTASTFPVPGLWSVGPSAGRNRESLLGGELLQPLVVEHCRNRRSVRPRPATHLLLDKRRREVLERIATHTRTHGYRVVR